MRVVLEGGGSRAAFSAGVLWALERAAVPCEVVVGGSTSAVNAAYFAARQMDTCMRLWREVVPDDFISYRRLLTPFGRPAIDVDRMVDDVLQRGWSKLDVARALDEAPVLYVAATEVPSGEARVVRPTRDNLFEWLRASTALPVGYNRTVRIDGRSYVDGGLSAPVPFEAPLEVPYDDPTVVVLTRRTHVAKKRPGWWQRAFLSVVVPREIREPSMRQHELYNRVVQKLTTDESGALVVVSPPEDMTLSRLTRDRPSLERGLDIGVRVGEELAGRLMAERPSASR